MLGTLGALAGRVGALPGFVKALLLLVALPTGIVTLVLTVLLSRLLAVLALLIFTVNLLALIFRVLRHRPLTGWSTMDGGSTSSLAGTLLVLREQSRGGASRLAGQRTRSRDSRCRVCTACCPGC